MTQLSDKTATLPGESRLFLRAQTNPVQHNQWYLSSAFRRASTAIHARDFGVKQAYKSSESERAATKATITFQVKLGENIVTDLFVFYQ